MLRLKMRKAFAKTLGFTLSLSISSSLASAQAQSNANASSPLDAKLKAQFDLYDKARSELINRVGCGGNSISRDDWEKLIKPSEANSLTPNDLGALKSRQAATIQQAKEKAVEASKDAGIDLRDIASKKLTEDFCSALPKGAMLHVHPDGTISETYALKLLESANPLINRNQLVGAVSSANRAFNACEIGLLKTFPESKKFSELSSEQKSILASLVAMTPTSPEQNRFPEFEAKFSFIKYVKSLVGGKLDGDPSELIISDYLDRASDQQVMAVEFSKGCSPYIEGVEEVSNAFEKFSKKTGVSVRQNCGFARTMSADGIGSEAKSIFQGMLERQNAGKPVTRVTGIDLFANEGQSDRDVSALGAGQKVWACLNYFKEKKGLKIKSTMHAGEFGDPRNPRDAMIMGADRLGHGVLLKDDPVAIEYALKRKTAIEINLVSNERLNSVSSLRSHPFLNYMRLGIPVSLSTDDDGIFQTSPNTECVRAIQESDINYTELKTMSYNSIAMSFAPEEEKAQHRTRLDQAFKAFEEKWSTKTPQGKSRMTAGPHPKPKIEIPRNSCADEKPPAPNAHSHQHGDGKSQGTQLQQ